MLDVNFHAEGVEAAEFSATPLFHVKLRITTTEKEAAIHSIMLRCQVRIEPTQRRYGAGEKEKLSDLFGARERWGQTVRSMLWMNTSVMVPGFIGSTEVDLPLPCTFDFNVAATKYFYGLEEGEAPLCLLFSGTIFYRVAGQGVQVAQIPWEKEAAARLPVAEWKRVMERHYPGSVWLSLPRGLFDQIYAYKRERGMATWEQALESLLAGSLEKVAP